MAFRKPVFGKYDAVRGQHANPKSRSMAARKLVERFHSSLHMVPEIKDEFGRFVDLLSVNGFCREDFGQHFVDA